MIFFVIGSSLIEPFRHYHPNKLRRHLPARLVRQSRSLAKTKLRRLKSWIDSNAHQGA
jgi:hypothetical protein